MTGKNKFDSVDAALKKLPQQEILALASRLHDAAKARVATHGVSQEEMKILNNARQQLRRHGAR